MDVACFVVLKFESDEFMERPLLTNTKESIKMKNMVSAKL